MPDTVLDPLAAPRTTLTILAAESAQASGAQPPSLPRLSAEQARLARSVGRGLSFPLPGAPMTLTLRPDASADWDAALRLDTPAGPVDIAYGARLLQGLTGLPPDALRAAGGAERAWIAAALQARLAGTPFAGATLGEGAPAAPEAASCRLQLSLGSRRHLLTMPARAAASTWLGLLARDGWIPERSATGALRHAHTVATVTVARHALPERLLASLAPGDVIVPAQPRFRADGTGWLFLGGRRLRVRYAAPHSFEVLELEAHVEIDDMPNDSAGPAPDQHAADPGDTAAQALFADAEADAPEGEWVPYGPDEGALDGLPVELNFEVGKVSVSLADARTLGPGAVVLLVGGAPEAVAITSAGHTLGYGEIVDVEGQLGIRLTQWRTVC